MFRPDAAVFDVIDQVSYMFHVVIGVDPIGNFTACEDLGYEVDVHEYKELGRNATMVRRPEWPGRPSELTLRWGFIIYPKMFEWMRLVEAGGDYRQHVFIIQLTMQRVPIRVYWLANAWPKSWKAANLNVEEEAKMSTEELVLVYDNIQMLNLGAAAVAVQLATNFEFQNDYEALVGTDGAFFKDYEALVGTDGAFFSTYEAEVDATELGEVAYDPQEPEDPDGSDGVYGERDIADDPRRLDPFGDEAPGDPEVEHETEEGRDRRTYEVENADDPYEQGERVGDEVTEITPDHWESAGTPYAALEPLEHELGDHTYEAIGATHGYDLETIKKLRALMKKRLQAMAG